MATLLNKNYNELDTTNSQNGNRGLQRFIPNTRVSFFLILIIQIVILYFFISPINLLQQLTIVQVINEVAKLTPVPPTEIPTIVASIGDKTNLPDVDTIKQQNSLNAQVYKDAKNGDYVLAYSNRMIIYRKDESKIIYDGDTPTAIGTKQQTDLANKVIQSAKTAKIIQDGNNEAPQLSVITDVSKLQGTNAEFYKNAQTDDIVGIFAQAGIILIYRPTTDSIIKSGDYTFVIK